MIANQIIPYANNQNNFFNSALYVNIQNFKLNNESIEKCSDNKNQSSPFSFEKIQNDENIKNYLPKELIQMIITGSPESTKVNSFNSNNMNQPFNSNNIFYGKKLNFVTEEIQNGNYFHITNSNKKKLKKYDNNFVRNDEFYYQMNYQYENVKKDKLNHRSFFTKNFNDSNENNKIKKNKIKKNKKKDLIERKGDWICYKCKNLNFSFRDFCNRCNLNKEISEQMYKNVEKKLYKYIENEHLNVSTSDTSSINSNK